MAAALPACWGFTHNTPSASTLHTIFKGIGVEVFEAKVGAWTERVTSALPPLPEVAEAAAGLTTSQALRGYSDWPGLAQVFRLERQVITKKGVKERMEVVYGVTRLSAERVTAAQFNDSHLKWESLNQSL